MPSSVASLATPKASQMLKGRMLRNCNIFVARVILLPLGKHEGVEMSFAFERLDDRITVDAIADDHTLLDWLEWSVAAS